MGQPIARIGDIGVGTCAAHKSPMSIVTTIQTGATRSRVEGKLIATRISIGICSCGHASVVVTHSGTARAEKNGIHRLNDTGLTAAGTYTMITAASKTRAGG